MNSSLQNLRDKRKPVAGNQLVEALKSLIALQQQTLGMIEKLISSGGVGTLHEEQSDDHGRIENDHHETGKVVPLITHDTRLYDQDKLEQFQKMGNKELRDEVWKTAKMVAKSYYNEEHRKKNWTNCKNKGDYIKRAYDEVYFRLNKAFHFNVRDYGNEKHKGINWVDIVQNHGRLPEMNAVFDYLWFERKDKV